MANSAYGLSIMSFDIENPSDVSFRGAHESLISMIKSSGRVLLPMMMITDDNDDDDDDRDNINDGNDNTDDITDNIDDIDLNNINPILKGSSLLVTPIETTIDVIHSSIHNSNNRKRRRKSALLLSREEIEQLRIFAHYVKVQDVEDGDGDKDDKDWMINTRD